MSIRHEIERSRFFTKYGDHPILKTAELIALGMWFSWRLCKKRMRGVDRRDGMRLLRQSAKARLEPEPEQKWLLNFAQTKEDPFRFFDIPICPEAYHTRCQPVMLDGVRVGVTIRSERIKGNRARVYYTSKLPHGLQCVGVEIKNLSSANEKAIGINNMQTIFKVKKETK